MCNGNVLSMQIIITYLPEGLEKGKGCSVNPVECAPSECPSSKAPLIWGFTYILTLTRDQLESG